MKRPMLPVRRLDPDFIGMEEAHRVGLMHISTVLTEDMIRKAAETLNLQFKLMINEQQLI